MDIYKLQQWQGFHMMMEDSFPLFFCGCTARHTCCLPGTMALQSKAQGRWYAVAVSVKPLLQQFGFVEVTSAGSEGLVLFTAVLWDFPDER